MWVQRSLREGTGEQASATWVPPEGGGACRSGQGTTAMLGEQSQRRGEMPGPEMATGVSMFVKKGRGAKKPRTSRLALHQLCHQIAGGI